MVTASISGDELTDKQLKAIEEKAHSTILLRLDV